MATTCKTISFLGGWSYCCLPVAPVAPLTCTKSAEMPSQWIIMICLIMFYTTMIEGSLNVFMWQLS